MHQQRSPFHPMLSTPDGLRQEAIAVHARLAAMEAFMQRQRASTAVRQRNASTERDGRVSQPDTVRRHEQAQRDRR